MTRRDVIAERIKTMRMSRGMSQQDLANALHCGQSTIAMYETGKRTPDMDTIDYLADIFNVPPYSIMYSEDEMASKHNLIGSALQEIGEKLTSPTKSKEWKALSEGFERMEQQKYDEFMAIFNMLKATKPEYFNEGDDDNDTNA